MCPMAGGFVHLPQSGHGVPGVLFGADHEDFILGHFLAEGVHLGVDKHGRQMLDGYAIPLVLVSQGGREALHVGL